MKILDCTLRDGGYYTHWDFSKELVYTYISACNKLPIDYIEIGYRSLPMQGYFGEYFYCPEYVMREIYERSDKKLAIILNEKDVREADAIVLLTPCLGVIDLVRIAIDPKNFSRALNLAKAIKNMGFSVAFNIMYMSTWKLQPAFLAQLGKIKGLCDYFYMVDSFGGVYPDDVVEIYNLVKEQVEVPIGFHGHNNLELALINTLTAINSGASMVDATMTGMGRGAGNLKTELLLTSLNAKSKLDVDFDALTATLDGFSKLQEQYNWGTNLPYMVSGANSLPQKEVMDWVGKQHYSVNSIIRALQNQSKNQKDNAQYPVFKRLKSYENALIIGGGPSVLQHQDALNKFMRSQKNLVLIHASAKNSLGFQDITQEQVFCLLGNEGYRLERIFNKNESVNGVCVLPPYPRKMGTYVPKKMKNACFELEEIRFTDMFQDTHTAIALQTALDLNVKKIYLAGYDGYSNVAIENREHQLFLENDFLFKQLERQKLMVAAITETSYKSILATSVYALEV